MAVLSELEISAKTRFFDPSSRNCIGQKNEGDVLSLETEVSVKKAFHIFPFFLFQLESDPPAPPQRFIIYNGAFSYYAPSPSMENN